MKKFQTMGELIAYMVGANTPNELKAEAENQMQAVIEVRNHLGQPRQHDKQVFEFAELSVRV